MTKKYKYTGKRNNGEEKPPGYVFGRPTTYKSEYCEMLITHMTEGFSFESFGALVDTHRTHLYEWAKKLGNEKAAIWWEKLHRRCAATGEGNATMIIWAQKNKWPKQYCERAIKNNNVNLNQTLNHAITGDFKSLVATMTPQQLYELSVALEQKTVVLEATNDKKESSTTTTNRANKNE